MRLTALGVVAGAALLLAGCGGGGGMSLFGGDEAPVGPPREDAFTPFDANMDGIISKAELDAGVNGLFKRDDTDADGFLNATEVRAVNDRLVAEAGPGATPVIDWNADGRVNAQEYGAQWRTLFDRADVNGDGVVDPRERAGRVKPRQARPLPEPGFGGYRGRGPFVPAD